MCSGRFRQLCEAVDGQDGTGLTWVARLVEGVISRDARIALVVLCQLLPQPHNAVLEVLVVPEIGRVCVIVRVPGLRQPRFKFRADMCIYTNRGSGRPGQRGDRGWCRFRVSHTAVYTVSAVIPETGSLDLPD